MEFACRVRACARLLLMTLLVYGLGMAVFCATAGTAPLSQVDISPQPEGGYLIATPVYKARVNADGNLHALQVNGIEFLDDRVTGSAGASFFVDHPLALPTTAIKDRALTATDGTYTVQSL